MPFVGKDWSHKGICEFYTNLEKNNYVIVYLTARNFGQAKKTLKYLKSVKQKKYRLPEGPLILSPDSMYQAFKREIIIGRCLNPNNQRQPRSV
jgi:phosphatidate phosphatase LPIN